MFVVLTDHGFAKSLRGVGDDPFRVYRDNITDKVRQIVCVGGVTLQDFDIDATRRPKPTKETV